MSKFRDSLGDLVRTLRQQGGLTQAELAERSQLSVKYIGEIERGEANATVDAVEHIADALGLHAWDVFNVKRPDLSVGHIS